jgi:DNA replication and repair protein RecF
MMRSLTVESLSIRGFRNLASVDLELGPRFNVLSGDNGQGKTNLLEAAYVLATSRSFRTSRLLELVDAAAGPGATASVRAVVREEDERHEQSVGLRHGVRAVRIDGNRPPTLAIYAVRTPVVAFHSGVMALSAGSGAERRKLLDRLSLYLWPASFGDADAYGKAMRARQRVLESRGESGVDLDGWEELMVRHGVALGRARERAGAMLGAAAGRAFDRIGAEGLGLFVRYDRRFPEDAEAFRAELRRSRVRDRARGSASSGPHRDDLALELGGRSVRSTASQGQHRAVVLSLELAEMEIVAEARGAWPILLLDDVSSELDGSRTEALLATLESGRGQVLLTTTRPELFDTSDSFEPEERRDFSVVSGVIRPIARGSRRGPTRV